MNHPCLQYLIDPLSSLHVGEMHLLTDKDTLNDEQDFNLKHMANKIQLELHVHCMLVSTRVACMI